MAKTLQTQVEIDATPDEVWRALTDFSSYPTWNPFLTSAEGRPTVGTRISVRMQPVGGRAMTFHPLVLEATPPRRLRWIGHLLIPGLFDGEHSFTIEPLGDGRVRVTQQENFRGVLVPLLSRQLDRRTRPAFELMNAALKRRAERA